MKDMLPAWLTPQEIDAILAKATEPDSAELSAILEKSLALQPLGLAEVAALLRVESKDGLRSIFEAADKVKQKVYGDRVVLTAPLHLSNHCGSECLYCANRRSNTLIERKYMTPPEMREAALHLIRQGHKRVILVSGQLPNADVEYLTEAVSIMYTVYEDMGELRRVNINAGLLSADDFRTLVRYDIGTALIFQETYHEESYRAAHKSGPKSNYFKRLNGPDVAKEAGVNEVGLGLLLGLGPWQFDLLALTQHSAHLLRLYGEGAHTVFLFRMRPAPGALLAPPYALRDADYLRCVAITRLALPTVGLILTTREPSGLWRNGCSVGASQLITGSLANPYHDWNEDAGEHGVLFPMSENLHVDEVVRFLLEECRHLPSFCTACPRLGRVGTEFNTIASDCGMRSQCGPNSIASFMEFLLHYATPYTRGLGDRLIAEKLRELTDGERMAAVRMLQKVLAGRVDEFI